MISNIVGILIPCHFEWSNILLIEAITLTITSTFIIIFFKEKPEIPIILDLINNEENK
jgi:hypothetical protein